MMQIRPVFVGMLYRIVFMPVHMVGGGRKTAVFMGVMGVLMVVNMLMKDRIMPVDVCVLLGEKQHQRNDDDPGRQRLRHGEGLPQNGHGKQHSEKRRC